MFRKLLNGLIAACLLFAGGCSKPDSSEEPGVEETVVQEEEKTIGMWFSYLEYRNLCAEMDEEAFRAFTEEAVANMKSVGVNTLYLHAVAFTDALYDSDIYPASAYKPGDYDPYLIFSETAHNEGLKVHAWVNPMRSVAVTEADSLPSDSPIKAWIESNDERVRQNGDRYYLNPAYPEVRSLICSVVSELLEKYHPDGIHLDDYFYPYGTERSFDAYIYSRAQEENPDLTLEDFRRANTDRMVKDIHDTVKAFDANTAFGISPAGNLDNCINLIYADPHHWVEQGTVDYLIPQIYWGYLHPIKPFEPTLEEWKAVTAGSDTKLMVGLAAYVIGLVMNLSENETVNREWADNDDMMARQMETVFNNGGDGVVFFSYSSLFAPDEETIEIVENEILHIKKYLEP